MNKLLSVVICCLLSVSVFAQFTLQKDLPLSYLVSQPKNKVTKPGLIILLHGYGSNEADLFGLREMLPADFLVTSVRAPMTLAPNAYQWFRSETIKGVKGGNLKDLKTNSGLIRGFIKGAVKKFNADPSRVYLIGFSQGAMMSFEVGLTSPELLKGIAPLSGRIFESLRPQVKPSGAFKNFKIFIGHGTADEKVLYHYATEASAYLKEKQIPSVLHTYPGMQHSISEQEINDLVKWLKEK